MGIIIELHIFSGVENPKWVPGVEQEKAILAALDTPMVHSQEEVPFDVLGLGYRGFELTINEEDKSRTVRVFAGRVYVDDLRETFINSKLEDILLETFTQYRDKEFITGIKEDIDSAGERLAIALTYNKGPVFDPAKWNSNGHIKKNNNCYNYASDRITNTFAQPGRGGGAIFKGLYCSNVQRGVRTDGWGFSVKKDDERAYDFVRLVVWEQNDFHWYRLDSNGLWSHKPGSTNAINTDNAGKLISDPKTCNRGRYKTLCNLWHSPIKDEWLTIR